MKLERNSKCDWCHAKMLKGEEAYELPDGWGHQKCADFMWERHRAEQNYRP